MRIAYILFLSILACNIDIMKAAQDIQNQLKIQIQQDNKDKYQDFQLMTKNEQLEMQGQYWGHNKCLSCSYNPNNLPQNEIDPNL